MLAGLFGAAQLKAGKVPPSAPRRAPGGLLLLPLPWLIPNARQDERVPLGLGGPAPFLAVGGSRRARRGCPDTPGVPFQADAREGTARRIAGCAGEVTAQEDLHVGKETEPSPQVLLRQPVCGEERCPDRQAVRLPPRICLQHLPPQVLVKSRAAPPNRRHLSAHLPSPPLCSRIITPQAP